jgi:FHA domain/Prokaryotic RING finger family 1
LRDELLSKPGERRCPLCRDLLAGDPVSCSWCQTSYHQACYQEHGGCATLGCVREGRAAPSATGGLIRFVQFLSGARDGQVEQLHPTASILLGSGEDDHVLVPGPDVEPSQCLVYPGDGHHWLQDHGVGMTVLGTQRVTSATERLEPGSVFMLGNTVLKLWDEPPPARRPLEAERCLQFLCGPRDQESEDLHPTASLLLGKGPKAHIQVPDPEVMEEHCVVYPAEGSYWLQDLGQGFTVVGGQRLSADSVRLEPGEVLIVGRTYLKVR